jgi:hypothetical protein
MERQTQNGTPPRTVKVSAVQTKPRTYSRKRDDEGYNRQPLLRFHPPDYDPPAPRVSDTAAFLAFSSNKTKQKW